MFVILMAVGLVGLVVMALPAIGRHSAIRGVHGGHAHGIGAHGHGHAHAPALGSKGMAAGGRGGPAVGPTRFIPSPRVIFSLLALYGAFGNALVHAHVPEIIAYFAAVVPAVLVERLAVTPLWNLLLRFQGEPSAPLEELILSEARAETPFRNGKGLVSVVREGRRVQLVARLSDEQTKKRIEVGDLLTVEDVDASNERLTVSVREE